MNKIKNYRVEIQESEDYKFGWDSADRGEPAPDWYARKNPSDQARLKAQRLGWTDFYNQEAAL